MTAPGPALPPITDPGNTLLGNLPFTLVTSVVPQPDGSKLGLVTFRCGNSTMTLAMDQAAAGDTRDTLAELARALGGGALLIPARGEAMQIAAAARIAGNGQAAPGP